jgi:peptidoglycan/LPS O-acetylase OafA/YrhL
MALNDNQNNFGFVRLVCAALVMVSHSAELVDGNRSRELLTILFGSISFGELAVDGFFLVSGFLITKSFLYSQTAQGYFVKRALRIFPGFIAAYLFCILIIGPIAGGDLQGFLGLKSLVVNAAKMASLAGPSLNGSFAGLPYSYLNGSMWTIRYEFGCYVLTALLGAFGVLRSNKLYILLFITSILLMTGLNFCLPHLPLNFFDVRFLLAVRLTAIYICGGAFYLFRKRIPYNWELLTASVMGLSWLLFSKNLAEPALAVLGGYLLFGFVFNYKSKGLSRIGRDVDLSYGIYLYAWPIQNLIVWNYRGIPPWLLCSTSLCIVVMLAYCSWFIVERPFLNLKKSLIPARSA